jgi:transposase InsO family protein
MPTTQNGCNAVMVIVDRLTKMVVLIPCKKNDSAEECARLFIKHWYAQGMGLPTAITSDRDSKFTSKFWRALCASLGIKQRLATARHQQTDGLAEIAIRTMKRTARKFASYANDDWDQYFHLIQYPTRQDSRHSS